MHAAYGGKRRAVEVRHVNMDRSHGNANAIPWTEGFTGHTPAKDRLSAQLHEQVLVVRKQLHERVRWHSARNTPGGQPQAPSQDSELLQLKRRAVELEAQLQAADVRAREVELPVLLVEPLATCYS